MNEDGYLKFDTLHELAQNASLLYSTNPLFGTFDDNVKRGGGAGGGGGGNREESKFDWTTYADFGWLRC